MQDKPLILCVDDDPTILEVLRQYLEMAGYQVTTAENGAAAIEVAQSRAVDLALLDIKLPGKSGIEILKELRAIDEEFYVIMVSSVEDISITLNAMSEGAHDFIGKPIDARQLIESVKKALELKRVSLWEANLPPSGKWVRGGGG